MKKFFKILGIIIILLVGIVYLYNQGKETSDSINLNYSKRITEFETAINAADFSDIEKYLSESVYVVLYGSECCGDITKELAKSYLTGINGLTFSFNSKDKVVKDYLEFEKTQFDNRHLLRESPELYFDQLIIGVESDISQPNKAAIGYSVSNGKVDVLHINRGRDRK